MRCCSPTIYYPGGFGGTLYGQRTDRQRRSDPAGRASAQDRTSSSRRSTGRFVPWTGLSVFCTGVEVWDMGGRVIRQIADLPLAEEVPTNRDA